MREVDYTKPVKVNALGQNRDCRVQFRLPDGGAIIQVDEKTPELAVHFDKYGRHVTSNHPETPDLYGCSLTVVNEILETVYLRVSTFQTQDNGGLSLGLHPQAGTGVAVVKLDFKNGILVDASLERSNEEPITELHLGPPRSNYERREGEDGMHPIV